MRGTIPPFVRIGSLHVNVWFEVVKNLAVDRLLGRPYIDYYIREVFPGERKVVFWHSDPVPILTRSTKIRRPSQSSAEPSRSRIPHDNVVVRFARQVTLKPSSKTRVMVSSPSTGLSYTKPAHLCNQISIYTLHEY